jgi:hypothetical protein
MDEKEENYPTPSATSSGEESAPFSAYDPSPNAKCDIEVSTCGPCRDLIELLLTNPLVSQTDEQSFDVG